MKYAIPSRAYEDIAQKLIATMPELGYIKASNVTIAYLVSDQAKKEGKTKPVYAETEKIPDKYKWGMQADFSITFYFPNASVFTESQREILVFQQLLKIGIEYDEDKDEEKYFLNEPDVIDFAAIIKRYGVNWKQTQRELFTDEEDIEAAGQSEEGFDIFN